MRQPMVIVCRYCELRDRADVDGAPIWGWSSGDGAKPSICDSVVPGDYVVWHEAYTQSHRAIRRFPWSVLRARAKGNRFEGRRASVAIGCGAISRHRTVEAAVRAAQAMLRRDEASRAEQARRACEAGEPVACPDADRCRHGIDG